MTFFTGLPGEVGFMYWTHVMDCASGQTMCLDAYRTRWTPNTTRKQPHSFLMLSHGFACHYLGQVCFGERSPQ